MSRLSIDDEYDTYEADRQAMSDDERRQQDWLTYVSDCRGALAECALLDVLNDMMMAYDGRLDVLTPFARTIRAHGQDYGWGAAVAGIAKALKDEERTLSLRCGSQR